MHAIASTDINYTDNGDSNDIIYYNFVGNFIPPEWRELKGDGNKTLSKTARQLLSLIVFRLQVCNNSNLDELQESYHFFEQSLGVCQRRVRQCMLELAQRGFIHLYNATVIKQYIKCRNIPCIRLAKNFRPYPKNFSLDPERKFVSTRKKFQVHNIIDINNKSNISRSSESTFLQNVDKFNEQKSNTAEILAENLVTTQDPTLLKQQPKSQIGEEKEQIAAISENAIVQLEEALSIKKSNNWHTRKKLLDFHPLTEEDAEILQIRSKREFNLNFINRLLLKLSEQYPDYYFYNKKVVLNYMVKALINEFREASQVNNGKFRFKTYDPEKLQEQYLTKIENSTDNSKKAQLKRKIIGVFDSDTAYQILNSCSFGKVIADKYHLQLTKDILLLEHAQNKILQQVQLVYGKQVKQLQITPFKQDIVKKEGEKITNNAEYAPLALSGTNHDSVWYRIRYFLIKEHGKYMDDTVFSKLQVVKEDSINNKLTLKPETGFIYYMLNQHYTNLLQLAVRAQDFTYELLKA